MSKYSALAYLAATAAFASVPAQAATLTGFTVTVEDPGVTQSSAGFDNFGVETFEGRSTGVQTFTSDFGGSPFTGEYSNINVIGFDQYGGAGNTGQYGVSGIGQTSSYSIDFSGNTGGGINYFGYWLSALDAGNTVEFWSGGSSLGTFDPAAVLSYVSGNSDYYGNPVTGQNSAEPYVFVNFYKDTGTFDKIVFNQTNTGAGYESDNHTVGWYNTPGGNPVPGVPEPSTWALMLLGFGAVGGVMRASNRKTRLSLKYA